MARPLKIAVAGLGRMGQVHALHVHELARDTGTCELAAVADLNRERASSVLTEMGADVPIFGSIEEMVSARNAAHRKRRCRSRVCRRARSGTSECAHAGISEAF